MSEDRDMFRPEPPDWKTVGRERVKELREHLRQLRDEQKEQAS